MRLWFVLGAFAAAALPMSAAAEPTEVCQNEEARSVAPERSEAAPAPQRSVARPTVAQRDVTDVARGEAPRRRNGKRVPDAELIGPRGAL